MIWECVILVACIYLVFLALDDAYCRWQLPRLERKLARFARERDERHAAMRAEFEARNEARRRAWLAARGLGDQPR